MGLRLPKSSCKQKPKLTRAHYEIKILIRTKSSLIKLYTLDHFANVTHFDVLGEPTMKLHEFPISKFTRYTQIMAAALALPCFRSSYGYYCCTATIMIVVMVGFL